MVGQVTPLTGLEAIQGRAYSAGLQLALDSANKAGGVAGHTFSLVRQDDSSRPEDTVALTQKVLADAKPIALAGYIGNRNLSELLKAGLLEKEKIALVGYRSTELRGEVPYLYSVRAGLRVGFFWLGFFIVCLATCGSRLDGNPSVVSNRIARRCRNPDGNATPGVFRTIRG